jgi:hypothetical protein
MDEDSRTGEDAEGTDEETDLDAQSAALLMAQARERAERELTIPHPVMFLLWGLVYLVGYGAIWLSVRDQRPYTAPAPLAITAVFVIATVALAFTVAIIGRAASGVGGGSDARRRSYFVSLGAGYIGFLIVEAALRHAGASEGVIGVFGAVGPFLVIGVAFAASSAARLDWVTFGLGIWLIAGAAAGGFAGPATAWGVEALTVGAGFLAAGAVHRGRRRA